MQKLPLRFYDTNNNGDLMSRFTNDVDTIGNMLSSTLVQLLSGALSIIGTLVLMIYEYLPDCDYRCYDTADDESGRLCGRQEPEVFLGPAVGPGRAQWVY